MQKPVLTYRSAEDGLHCYSFFALGGPNEIQLYGGEKIEADSRAGALVDEVTRIETKYSRYRPDSMVSRINKAAGSGEVTVDEETAVLLDYAATCSAQSGGLFDITSGILRRAWDFKVAKPPRQSEIDELLPLIGWDKVEWRKPFIRLTKVGMEIDFGGFGKEYAVDRLAGMCIEWNISAALINLGGDVRSVGSRPQGQPFEVGVVHPRQPGRVLAKIPLMRLGLATSGDYERYFEYEGRRYCHILNPHTGWPVDSFQSVSVVSESTLVAGSASTTAMLLGEGKGQRFLKDSGLKHLLVHSNGKVAGSMARY